MGFGNKKEKEEKELAANEAIVELGKAMKAINTRLDKMEQQPKEVKPVEQPATPEIKPQVVKQPQRYIVQDVATATQPTIYDLKDKENPQPLDLHAAIVEVLNRLSSLKTDLS